MARRRNRNRTRQTRAPRAEKPKQATQKPPDHTMTNQISQYNEPEPDYYINTEGVNPAWHMYAGRLPNGTEVFLGPCMDIQDAASELLRPEQFGKGSMYAVYTISDQDAIDQLQAMPHTSKYTGCKHAWEVVETGQGSLAMSIDMDCRLCDIGQTWAYPNREAGPGMPKWYLESEIDYKELEAKHKAAGP